MKKKILLVTLIVAALSCLFAISVGAAVVTDEIKHTYFPQDGEVEVIEGIEAGNHIHADILENYPDAKDARVRVKCSCERGYHIYPTYYITDVKHGEYFEFDYTEFNSKNPCKMTHNKNTLVALEMPNGYTTFDGNADKSTDGVRKSSSLEYMDMSTCTTLSTLSTATKGEPFCDCTALKYVKMSSATTRIGGWMFIRCSELLIVDIPVDSKIEHIGVQAFKNCPKLSALYLPDSIKTIGFLNDGGTLASSNKNNDEGTEGDAKGVFYGCTNLFFVNNPEDTEKPDVYYMPQSLEKVTSELFKNLDNISDVVVFGENFYYLNNGFAFSQINKADNKPTTFVFEGDFSREGAKFEYSCEMTYINIYFTNENVKDFSFITYATSWNGATPSNCFAYICQTGLRAELSKQNYPTANALFYPTLNATTDGFCHVIEQESADLVYESYLDSGYFVDKCFCGVTQRSDKEPQAPLFSCLGYSASETGLSGILIGYLVNKEAVSEYQAVTGKTLSYGVFAVSQEKLGEADIFDGNGTAVSGAIIAETSSYGAMAFELKIVGFAEEQKSTRLAFGAYVATASGEDTEYSYLQDKAQGELAGKYYFVSYNDIVNG